MYFTVDIFAHSGEIIIDFVICYPYNGYAETFKYMSPFFITDDVLVLVMLTAVELDDQFRFCAIKVGNVIF